MSDPLTREERLCAMFDSYCKTVLRNASRNINRTQKNRRKHETLVDEKTQYIFENQVHEDNYSFMRYVISLDKFSCIVSNEILYKAMLSLPECQLMVIILDFWYDWPEGKIADYINVTPRTVYNLRQRAFKAMREILRKEGMP